MPPPLRDQIAAALRDAEVARKHAAGYHDQRTATATDHGLPYGGACAGCADLRPLADLPDAARAPYYVQADAVLAVIGPVLADGARP